MVGGREGGEEGQGSLVVSTKRFSKLLPLFYKEWLLGWVPVPVGNILAPLVL